MYVCMYVHIYIYIHMYTYIIYIYICYKHLRKHCGLSVALPISRTPGGAPGSGGNRRTTLRQYTWIYNNIHGYIMCIYIYIYIYIHMIYNSIHGYIMYSMYSIHRTFHSITNTHKTKTHPHEPLENHGVCTKSKEV